MSDELRVDYRPKPDISPEHEAGILASVYRYLLERHAEKAANSDSRLEPEGGADEALRTKTQGDSKRVERQ